MIRISKNKNNHLGWVITASRAEDAADFNEIISDLAPCYVPTVQFSFGCKRIAVYRLGNEWCVNHMRNCYDVKRLEMRWDRQSQRQAERRKRRFALA